MNLERNLGKHWRSQLWSVLFITIVVCFVTLFITSGIQERATTYSPSPCCPKNGNEQFPFLHSYSEEESNLRSEPSRILLVSFFRSGSSWIGELLSQSPESFYVYEPLHTIPKKENWSEIQNSKEFLVQELFHCGISYYFMTHSKAWNALLPLMKKRDLSAQEITKNCISSKSIIIKVVFLVRDPRGTLNSLNVMPMKRPKLDACPALRENTLAFITLKKLFPQRLFFLRYEDVSRYPFEKALDLWNFVRTSDQPETIPDKWFTYLKKSMEVKPQPSKTGSFRIKKKSTHEWQKWRNEIPPELLKSIEDECGDILDDLGYRRFGSLNETRFSSSSAILIDNCTNLPCIF